LDDVVRRVERGAAFGASLREHLTGDRAGFSQSGPQSQVPAPRTQESAREPAAARPSVSALCGLVGLQCLVGLRWLRFTDGWWAAPSVDHSRGEQWRTFRRGDGSRIPCSPAAIRGAGTWVRVQCLLRGVPIVKLPSLCRSDDLESAWTSCIQSPSRGISFRRCSAAT
jgi:hypothetical protein